MGLMQKAYETYEAHAALIGLQREGHAPLCPVSHIVQKAQIEITLDGNGGFVRATAVSKEQCQTIIPATEDSASRTSGEVPPPHPLCDKLCYLSSDNKKKYEAYITELTKWVQSPDSHPFLIPVLTYVKSGTILEDLEYAGLVQRKPNGTLAAGKIEGIEYSKCLVRWRVIGAEDTPACWENQSLFKSFQAYYMSQQDNAKTGLCMITGEHCVLAEKHDKGIVTANNGAKLISSNDDSGFTFRGRFTKASQAGTIGYIASQKAHKALRWVASDQGVIIGGRTFLCWNPHGHPVYRPVSPFPRKETGQKITPSDYRQIVWETLSGFRNQLPNEEGVVIAVFDAATTGRLSVTYYNELRGSDFYDRIQKWYESCCWDNGLFGVQFPTLRQIVACAYGTERTEKGKAIIVADEQILKAQVQRLLRCMIDQMPVPQDIVLALVQRASRLQNYDRKTTRYLLLVTACAVIRKYKNDRIKKEEWGMALDPQKQDRSYQFGRLLAVMEKVERDTYDSDEDREPNAIRMQSVFCVRPMYASRLIYERLTPYFSKLQPATRAFYRNLLSDIFAKISLFPEDGLNRPLEDSYLLGYALQRKALYTSNKKKDMEEKKDGSI